MSETLKEKEKFLRHQVIETGLKLLDTELVARTWGNISGRLDGSIIIITPSGLDYRSLNNNDLPVLDYKSGRWTGQYKPSGEKLVHKAAYEIFPDVDFVVHTHQTYATAIGLCGFDTLDITSEESEALGGIALASYGLPGSKTLEDAVRKALETGAHTILMAHHGVLVAGKDSKDTMHKALLLEKICERNCKSVPEYEVTDEALAQGEKLRQLLQTNYEFSDVVQTPQAVFISENSRGITAQLDDMAQMVGHKAPLAKGFDSSESAGEAILKKMSKYPAILVPGTGIAVRAENAGDLEALKILMHKAVAANIHTSLSGEKKRLSFADSAYMHYVYCKKYSKQKK